MPVDGGRWSVSTPSLRSPGVQGRKAGQETQSQYPPVQLGTQGISAGQEQREGSGKKQLLQCGRDRVLCPECRAGPEVTMAAGMFLREK